MTLMTSLLSISLPFVNLLALSSTGNSTRVNDFRGRGGQPFEGWVLGAPVFVREYGFGCLRRRWACHCVHQERGQLMRTIVRVQRSTPAWGLLSQPCPCTAFCCDSPLYCGLNNCKNDKPFVLPTSPSKHGSLDNDSIGSWNINTPLVDG